MRTEESARGARARWVAGLLLGAAALAGCSSEAPAKPDAPPAGGRAGGKAEIVMAPEGSVEEVPAIVRAELERAQRDGRDLIVYVGAPWCEPCMRFHDAVKAGELDATFPTLRLLEFDHDRDEARLARAGYTSSMIPLFVAPTADGKASPLRIEGSVKGERAVAAIVPRLSSLLIQARAAAR